MSHIGKRCRGWSRFVSPVRPEQGLVDRASRDVTSPVEQRPWLPAPVGLPRDGGMETSRKSWSACSAVGFQAESPGPGTRARESGSAPAFVRRVCPTRTRWARDEATCRPKGPPSTHGDVHGQTATRVNRARLRLSRGACRYRAEVVHRRRETRLMPTKQAAGGVMPRSCPRSGRVKGSSSTILPSARR